MFKHPAYFDKTVYVGQIGERGYIGSPGSKGAQGEAGRPGSTGLQGIRGLTGRPGPPGRPGSPGERGIQGADGKPGEQGPQGIHGLPGPPGLPGDKGLTVCIERGMYVQISYYVSFRANLERTVNQVHQGYPDQEETAAKKDLLVFKVHQDLQVMMEKGAHLDQQGLEDFRYKVYMNKH